MAEVGSAERIFLAMAEIEDALPGTIPTLFEEGKLVGEVSKLSPATQALVPELVEAAKVITGKKEPYLCKELKHFKLHDVMPEILRDIVNSVDFQALAKRFDGMVHNLNEIQAKVLNFDYKHFLGPDITCERASRVKVNGFHHDHLGKIEKSGILNMKRVHENVHGCYKIEWSYLNSKSKYSTCFPQHWTPMRVMESISQAVNTAAFRRVKGDYLVFHGVCEAGFAIEVRVNEVGQVITAFPLL